MEEHTKKQRHSRQCAAVRATGRVVRRETQLHKNIQTKRKALSHLARQESYLPLGEQTIRPISLKTVFGFVFFMFFFLHRPRQQ